MSSKQNCLKAIFSIVAFVFGISTSKAQGLNCSDLFLPIAPLTEIEIQSTIEDLYEFRVWIFEKNDPVSKKLFNEKYQEMVSRIGKNETDRRLKEVGSDRSKRKKVEEKKVERANDSLTRELLAIETPMRFVSVKAGKFRMGEDSADKRNSVEVELTEDFEMMSTPVTQLQWAMLMKENPSHFKEGGQIKPDHPVENVSWNDVQAYIKKLNELSENNDLLIYEIIPSHKEGFSYRLPTEAEWEYVARSRGQANGKYFFGNSESELGKYAWYDGNSGNSTHAVATKEPMLLDNDIKKPIYDIHGNVWEWTQDYYSDLSAGKNPTGPSMGSYRIIRGGSWNDFARNTRSANRNYGLPDYRNGSVGFRLLRTNAQR